LGDHPAVPDEHDVLYPEPLPEIGDCVRDGLLVGDVALVHPHGDRASVGAADQPVVDLKLAFDAVAGVAERRQRAAVERRLIPAW
jgi:hypothetical protein